MEDQLTAFKLLPAADQFAGPDPIGGQMSVHGNDTVLPSDTASLLEGPASEDLPAGRQLALQSMFAGTHWQADRLPDLVCAFLHDSSASISSLLLCCQWMLLTAFKAGSAQALCIQPPSQCLQAA